MTGTAEGSVDGTHLLWQHMGQYNVHAVTDRSSTAAWQALCHHGILAMNTHTHQWVPVKTHSTPVPSTREAVGGLQQQQEFTRRLHPSTLIFCMCSSDVLCFRILAGGICFCMFDFAFVLFVLSMSFSEQHFVFASVVCIFCFCSLFACCMFAFKIWCVFLSFFTHAYQVLVNFVFPKVFAFHTLASIYKRHFEFERCLPRLDVFVFLFLMPCWGASFAPKIKFPRQMSNKYLALVSQSSLSHARFFSSLVPLFFFFEKIDVSFPLVSCIFFFKKLLYTGCISLVRMLF